MTDAAPPLPPTLPNRSRGSETAKRFSQWFSELDTVEQHAFLKEVRATAHRFVGNDLADDFAQAVMIALMESPTLYEFISIGIVTIKARDLVALYWRRNIDENNTDVDLGSGADNAADTPSSEADDTSQLRMGDDFTKKQEGVGARLLRVLSLSQLAAVLEDSTLGRLLARFEKRLREIDLPANGFTTKEQADAVQRLSSTFYQLQDVEAGFGLPLREKPAELREGERLRAEYMRHHDKEGRPIAVRRPGRPRRDVEIVAPKHIL
jgi:hypothetical protein